MDQQSDLLDAVVQELRRRTGDLPKVAAGCGMHVDTVRRIRDGDNDPGYSKVKALHAYLFPAATSARTARREKAKAH